MPIRLLRYFLLLSLLIGLAGCFDIKEEIYLRKNGTGRYICIFDFTKNTELYDELFKQNSVDFRLHETGQPISDVSSYLRHRFEKHIQETQTTFAGIKSVSCNTSKTPYEYSIEVEFNDINELNMLLSYTQPNLDKQTFEFFPGEITRYNYLPLLSALEEITPQSSSRKYWHTKESILQNIRYTSIIRLEGKIKSFNNKLYTFDKSHNLLSTEMKLCDFLYGKESINTTINFKKINR